MTNESLPNVGDVRVLNNVRNTYFKVKPKGGGVYLIGEMYSISRMAVVV